MLALARVQLSCTSSRHVARQVQVARLPALRREIHQTSVVLKKKKQQSSTQELFNESDDTVFAAEEDDLFSSSNNKREIGSQPKRRITVKRDGTTQKMKGKLSPEQRLERFDNLYQFLSDRIGLNPPAKARNDPRQVRKTAWQHLFSLATTAEQLESVTELFPKWRDARQEFTPKIAEAFIRRCEELRCPTLALKVFSDHSKYGFNLNYLPAARHLLHSLHVEHPLENSITLSALYGIYKLPAISSDLVSCAMLTAACFKAKSEDSLVVAKALVPELKNLLTKTKPKKMAYPEDKYTRSLKGNKEKAWLRWALLKVEKALQAHNEPIDWLRTWREASGTVPALKAA